jgi:hypothetical protein
MFDFLATCILIGCDYRGHEEPKEQRLKERSTPNFQTRNKTRLCE